MVKNIKAADLKAGDTFSYGAHTYVAAKVDADDKIVVVKCKGLVYPMDFYPHSEVRVLSEKPAKKTYKKGQPVETKSGIKGEIVRFKGYSKYMGRSYIIQDQNGRLWRIQESQFVS